MINVLAISGGGIFGVLPAAVLVELERRIGKPCSEHFQLMAGTSIGGILACGLSVGIPATQLYSLLTDRGGEIFPTPDLWGKIEALDHPKYSAAPLEAILLDVLQNHTLQDCHTNLLVTAYSMTRGEEALFKCRRFGKGAFDDPNYLLRDVARATSAAPTYFPPANVGPINGEKEALVDGGIEANNPSMLAILEAEKLYPGEPIRLLSLGTGRSIRTFTYDQCKDWGAADWVNPENGMPLISAMMNGPARIARYSAAYRLGREFYEIDTDLPRGGAMDDASPENIATLKAEGAVMAQSPVLAAFLS